tara:strand:+ start:950 stop:2041 length:1092 start_codon:yes stop_codon:yes gene_type:complete
MTHTKIYHEPGRFAGWPANYGIWNWGDEIVVSFTVGTMDVDGGFHARDRTKPFVTKQARSLDGGITWDVVDPAMATPGGRGLSADEHTVKSEQMGEVLDTDNAPEPCPGGIDFSHPDFALMCAKTGLSEGCRSFFYVSKNRCHRWEGPYDLPMYDQTGIAARTNYIVDDGETCTLYLTANKTNGKEGRVFCARSTDGGAAFDFLSFIGSEPDGYHILPAAVRLSDGELVCAIRCSGPGKDFKVRKCWIDLYRSTDNSQSWSLDSQPVSDTGKGGNPPTLTHLSDERLCLIYGYRDAPSDIRTKLSDDDGTTWGEETVLRTGGGCPDLGYPRTVQTADGTVVTCYYWNDTEEGERYIASTRWKP